MESQPRVPGDHSRSVATKMLIDSLIGAQIIGLYVAEWETNTFNNADFIYELADGRYIRMPDFYLTVTHIETTAPDSRHRRARCSDDEQDHYRRNLFGRTIVDIVIPRDHEIRHADGAAIKLDSGYYLMQESGAPQGIIPSVFLVESVDMSEMQSVFETDEWLGLTSTDRAKATEPRDAPKPPNGAF
jgi:hypothetical protein